MADAAPLYNSSALGVAVLRAVHQFLVAEPKILDDPIAGRLLDADVLQQFQSNPARMHEPPRFLAGASGWDGSGQRRNPDATFANTSGFCRTNLLAFSG
jgi:O-methyltransferase involved in polyketide biosynthesis